MTALLAPEQTTAPAEHPTGLRRSLELARLYRAEPRDPGPFYEFLARDTVEQLRAHGAELSGTTVDVGGGPGYLAEAVRGAGGRCVVVEYDERELRLHGRRPDAAVVGDGQQLPLADGVADLVHCSNVLEHVPRPFALVDELVRVLRPGGVGYLSFTPWLSPWGGHETSPWHYLGGERAARRYQRRTGEPAKNRYGRSLFALHVGPVRRQLADHVDVDVVWEGPRYWPPSWRSLGRVPVVGEALAWNHLSIVRRRP